jgi:hypothetical protein
MLRVIGQGGSPQIHWPFGQSLLHARFRNNACVIAKLHISRALVAFRRLRRRTMSFEAQGALRGYVIP